MDVGWMVGESGIKANSAQFSWSLAELGNYNKEETRLISIVSKPI